MSSQNLDARVLEDRTLETEPFGEFTIGYRENQPAEDGVVHFSCNSPWATGHFTLKILRKAKVTDDPPEVLSNGFYHDPMEGKLQIFWQQQGELQFSGSNLAHSVHADVGKNALIVGYNTAIFYDWDPTKAATVHIRRQSSWGRSTKSSVLQVPILMNSTRRRPQNLSYHHKTNKMSWKAPQDEKELLGYTVYWCTALRNNSQLCDDHNPVNFHMLEKSQLEFQWDESMAQLNKGVGARYNDNSGGGVQWIGPGFPENTYVPRLSFYLGFLIIYIIIMVFYCKWKSMAEIEISLPPIFDPIVMKELGVKTLDFA
ncbi:cytokine receptor-like [Drosophila rhopaloa]|uniref:Cytokine receptor-like n=1 Tax=Drosophila rhopaloa TaxID=1041015 RepID=A0ABM5H1U1_DRORH|nr:cytokine receptor-like [Drosophila rhopaloa]